MKQKPKPAIIKQDLKNPNMVEVKFYLTLGETMSLKNALRKYSESSCAQDVLAYLCNAEYEAKIKID